MIILLSLPFIRHIAFEFFLRGHQGLAALFLYGTWRHMPAHQSLSTLCIYIASGLFTLTISIQILLLCYYNIAFRSRYHTRAYIYRGITGDKTKNENSEGVIIVGIGLRRPMKLDAGQYVNLWMPTVNLFSWAQIHPFTVISWS